MSDKNKYEELLDKLGESREELKKYLSSLEECKDNILSTLSTSTDYRNKYAREERLKTLSTFFSSMLQVRQEYNRTIQSEIDIRRRLDKADDNDEVEIDIKKIAKQISQLNEERVANQ